MTFSGLLVRLVLGYMLGLFAGPLLGRYYSKPGDVSIRGGIAGGLGATLPYLLLNSVWVAWSAQLPPWLFISARHQNWSSFVSWLLVVTLTENLGAVRFLRGRRT